MLSFGIYFEPIKNSENSEFYEKKQRSEKNPQNDKEIVIADLNDDRAEVNFDK
jgi:hypothetical protein